jgi:hypothetical protein
MIWKYKKHINLKQKKIQIFSKILSNCSAKQCLEGIWEYGSVYFLNYFLLENILK